MSIKRGQNYHTVHVAQVEPFDSFWKRVLRDRSREAALFAEDGAILRTFQDVEEERAEWRARLSGFSAGDGVVGALGNDPSWPAFLLAGWDRALVIAPIEPDVPEAQLDRILELIQAQGLVRASSIECFDRPQVAWDGPKPDLLKITSGTTGAPRAVRFRESQLLADCRNICETMGIRPEDLNFGVIPFSHSYGFSNLITPLLFQGTGLICSTDRMPRAVYHHLRNSGATVFPGTPALFQALGSLSGAAEPLPLRLCISAGAPLAPEISREFHRRFGLKIHSFYGSSECGGIAYDRDDEAAKPYGFAGTPLAGVEVVKIDANRISCPRTERCRWLFPGLRRGHPRRCAILSRGPRRMVKSGNTSRWSCHRIRECRRKEGPPIRRRRTSPENAWGYRCNRLRNSVGNPQRRFGGVCGGLEKSVATVIGKPLS